MRSVTSIRENQGNLHKIEKNIQLTNLANVRESRIEIACLHKISPEAPTQLSNTSALQFPNMHRQPPDKYYS